MNIRDITKQIRVFADQLESQNAPEAEKPDPYAELKKAHAEGKVIEFWNHFSQDWESSSVSMAWCYPPERYRIKPESTFQLPPPPPGMQWHRTDGWQEGDLPQGMRPLVLEEHSTNATQQRYSRGWMRLSDSVIADPLEEPMRTTTPLTFTHAGKTWTWHRPGDPMPCDGLALVTTLLEDGEVGGTGIRASRYDWVLRDDGEQIVGWRYADETKTVPLGPEDVPPGSVLSRLEDARFDADLPGEWSSVINTDARKGCLLSGFDARGNPFLLLESWERLMKSSRINRSIPLTGKWNPDAWEPCEK